MEEERRQPPLSRILNQVAREMGASLLLDPQWHYAGQITFASGKRIYFRGPSLDINPHGASEIAKDKDFAAYFMRAMGFPAVAGETFFSDEWAAVLGSNRTSATALMHAAAVGYPLIVKPNSGSQGRGVQIVTNEEEMIQALSACFVLDRVVLLQPVLRGRDYRVVVLGEEIISAYERTPLTITSDGRQTIRELIAERMTVVSYQARQLDLVLNDARVLTRLGKEGVGLESVLPSGRSIRVLDVANLSYGGRAIDITGALSHTLTKTCVDLTRQMGLQLCGVDLMVDGDAREEGVAAQIIEINSSPGLDNYASLGEHQANRVLGLYRKVLEHLANKD